MKMHFYSGIVVLVAMLSHGAYSATQITDDNMTRNLNTGAEFLAFSYAPVWFFGQSQNIPPCMPTWTFGGSPTTPDVYDAAHKTPAVPRCPYPDVSCGCRRPDVGIGNRGPEFPIYYSYQKCNPGEVRIAYNLFYQKDGACLGNGHGHQPGCNGAVDTGHDYDWERVIIIFTKDNHNMWSPNRLLGSNHNGYHVYAWEDIQNTNTNAQAFAINSANADPRKNFGQKNQDNPSIFVAWSKHPHFDDHNTGFNDPISQSTDNAFRSDDWWVFSETYIRADDSTAAGQAIKNAGWGDANSNPASVNENMCGFCNGGDDNCEVIRSDSQVLKSQNVDL